VVARGRRADVGAEKRWHPAQSYVVYPGRWETSASESSMLIALGRSEMICMPKAACHALTSAEEQAERNVFTSSIMRA